MKLQPIKALRTFFGYDAVVDKKRRRRPTATTSSEDKAITTSEKKTLISTARDERRNITLLAWMIRQHLDYVSRFTFQSRTGNKGLDQRLESLVNWWSRKENCDVAGRHPLRRMIRLGEASRTCDGDIGFIKTRSGRLQAIEADRINTPRSQLPDRLKNNDDIIIHEGVVLDRLLRAREFLISDRKDKTGFVFNRTVSARNMLMHGYYDRFDQVRGISPLASALNQLQDLYETTDFQTLKIKFHAMFGIAIMRDSDDDAGDFVHTDADTGASPTENTDEYQFEIKPGLKMVLKPGDRIDTIESKTPSNEFNDYVNIMIQISILALDFPYTFFDSRKSSYSAQRQDILRYFESAKSKRADNQELLDEITAWKVGEWSRRIDTETGNPMLVLPDNMLPRDVEWSWTPTGIPWIDPLKEINAYGKAIALGLRSRKQISAELGLNWMKTVEDLESEEKEIVERGITVQVADPGATTTRDEEITTDEPETVDNPEGDDNDE